MDRIDKAFSVPEKTIGWAEKAFREFKAVGNAFFGPNPIEVVTERNAETRENVQKIRLTAPFPDDFSRHANSALVDTRHAFDQAIFAAKSVLGSPKLDKSNFPWATDETDLKRLLKERFIDQRLWDVLSAHHPYSRSDPGAADDNLVRTLATIANRKHTISVSADAHIGAIQHGRIRGKSIQMLEILRPDWDPVKNEAITMRWIGEAEMDEKYNVVFQVVLRDSRLPKPVDVGHALTLFTGKAKAVVESLKARCTELLDPKGA